MDKQTLTPREIHALAGAADVAVETVRRRLAGLPLRPSTLARLEAAAELLGVALPPRPPPATPAPAPPPTEDR